MYRNASSVEVECENKPCPSSWPCPHLESHWLYLCIQQYTIVQWSSVSTTRIISRGMRIAKSPCSQCRSDSLTDHSFDKCLSLLHKFIKTSFHAIVWSHFSTMRQFHDVNLRYRDILMYKIRRSIDRLIDVSTRFNKNKFCNIGVGPLFGVL